jgi:multidrug efflux system membrane fusion protein
MLLALLSASPSSSASGTERPQPSGLPPAIKVAAAESRNVPIATSGLGRVQAANNVLVKSRVDGPIVKVLFTEGEEVKEGQPLFEIDARPFQIAVAQAEADLAKDQAQLSSAKADLERTVHLLDKGFASRQAYDRQMALVGQSEAGVKADRAVLENARLNLSFTRITAPISGRIGKRLLDRGNLVRASDGTALAEIVQTHPVALLFSVPQAILVDIRAQREEQPLPVEALAAEDRHVLGRGALSLIGNQVDPQTGTIELKALFPNDDGALWPGQLVEARLVTHVERGTVSVPLTAVLPGSQGRFVYVVTDEGKVVHRPVAVLATAEGLAVINRGLAAGEKVVIEKQDLLAPGMAIRPLLSTAGEQPRDEPS